MAASQDLIDSVANENNKTGAGGPGFMMNLAMQNAVGSQNRLNILAEAALGNMTRRITELDPGEAAAIQKVTQADLGAQLSGLLTALNSGQQGAKVAQTTPPVTS